ECRDDDENEREQKSRRFVHALVLSSPREKRAPVLSGASFERPATPEPSSAAADSRGSSCWSRGTRRTARNRASSAPAACPRPGFDSETTSAISTATQASCPCRRGNRARARRGRSAECPADSR